jgi:hypothetical protein
MNVQSRETGNIGYTRKTKQKTQHNALDMHHYTQTNQNNVDKTWALLQTIDSKDEPNIVFPDGALVSNFGISVLYHKDRGYVPHHQVCDTSNKCPWWNRNCLPFRGSWVHLQLLEGIALLDLYFSMPCFIYHYFSYLSFTFGPIVLSVLLRFTGPDYPFESSNLSYCTFIQ